MYTILNQPVSALRAGIKRRAGYRHNLYAAFGGLSADLRAGLEADDEWRSRFQREEQRAAQAFRKHLRTINSPRDCRKAPLYVFTPYAFRSGIGSVLRALANALLQASAASEPMPRAPLPSAH